MLTGMLECILVCCCVFIGTYLIVLYKCCLIYVDKIYRNKMALEFNYMYGKTKAINV